VEDIMEDKAILNLDGKSFEFDIDIGSENEKCFDISSLREETGYITMDHGFGNTGSCFSAITYVDGANGVLQYRGYPFDQNGCVRHLKAIARAVKDAGGEVKKNDGSDKSYRLTLNGTTTIYTCTRHELLETEL
jgi:hypothetical protein